MSDFSSRLDEVGRSTSEPTLRLGRLKSTSHQSSVVSLFSNLRDFLFERPVKVSPGAPDAFGMPGFGAGIGENLKEFFHSGPRGNVRSDLLVDWKEDGGFWQNLRDLVAPKKLPPLQTTSKPIPVPEIWSKNPQFTRVQALSVAFHIVVLVILVFPILAHFMPPPSALAKSYLATPLDDVSKYLPKLAPAAKKAGGGGGQHDLTPASKGRLPKFAWTQLARPMVKPPDHPEIAVQPTVLGNPAINLPNINALNWGDPNSKTNGDSMGQGHGNGVGNGNGNGVGPGQGYNTGGGVPYAGTGGYGSPVCAYCPTPQFSDDAVKVKVQGIVELVATITADGRVTDIHVAKGLGFGLDEKAVETVRSWHLIPARGPDGKPAAVRQSIEVTFNLL
jgi:protein TonB